MRNFESWGLIDPDALVPGQVRSTDPDTSHAAASANLPRLATYNRMVLDAHYDHPEGLNDEEASNLTGIVVHVLSSRRAYLRTGGWLQDSGRRRKSSRGADQIVWVMTETGREHYRVAVQSEDDGA